MARVHRWWLLARLTVRYLLSSEDDRRDLLAILRREAWQARLLAAETARLADQAAHLAAAPRPSGIETAGEGAANDDLTTKDAL